ncbi:MAG: CBS domain-containing protein [Halioglobus sp.]|jgi:CBS domain-containing protein
MNVKTLLEKKGSAVSSIQPDATVFDALLLMEEKDIGALLVMQQEQLVGIITERDYARKVILRGKLSKDTLISEAMTNDVLFVSLDRKADECLALMTFKRCRHLPVMEDDKVVGLISMGDVVKNLIEEFEHTIQDYEKYIRGG